MDLKVFSVYLNSPSKYWVEIGLVLWNINYCRLFNVKSSLYIYIEYIWFGLVEFYDIVAYLMPNPLYTYILNKYMTWNILLIAF